MKHFIKLLLLGIAFGVIEASVVIYLRPLFNGSLTDFSLQIAPIQKPVGDYLQIIQTELYREVATLILIFAAAWLAAKTWWQGVCYFVFLFAVWDIVYYFWLFVRIGWPSSIMEWDILFLIPKAWYAPVIVPVIISALGILLSVFVIYSFEKVNHFKIKFSYIFLIVCSIILWYISFTHQVEYGQTEFPESYSWPLFLSGVAAVLLAQGLILRDFNTLRRNTLNEK